MQETFEKINHQNSEKPIDMNNFYFNLPGGYYRQYYGKNNKKTQLMDAIDRLLMMEFPHLDVALIYQTIQQTEQLISEVLNNHRHDPSRQDIHEFICSSIDRSKTMREQLRPLFNRLIAMGFDSYFLTR
jgi:hypothetical protein